VSRARRISAMLADDETRHAAEAEVASSIHAARGNLTHAAAALGVSNRALLRWVARYHGLADAVRSARILEDDGATVELDDPSTHLCSGCRRIEP